MKHGVNHSITLDRDAAIVGSYRNGIDVESGDSVRVSLDRGARTAGSGMSGIFILKGGQALAVIGPACLCVP